MPRTDGATRKRSSGSAHTGTSPSTRRRAALRPATPSHRRDRPRPARPGSARLAIDGEQARARPCASSASASDGDLPHLAPVCAGCEEPSCSALAGPAAEHQQHRSAEVRGDPGVVGEFGGAADVRVVAADDHDRVALGLDGLVALDDRRERGIRVMAHVVVGHADALVVLEVDAVVGQQHLEHVVALDGRAGDRRGRRPRAASRGSARRAPRARWWTCPSGLRPM